MFLIPGIKEECDMSMIQVENLTFAYPSSYDNIFENVNFQDGLPGLPIQKARVGSSQNLS